MAKKRLRCSYTEIMAQSQHLQALRETGLNRAQDDRGDYRFVSSHTNERTGIALANAY